MLHAQIQKVLPQRSFFFTLLWIAFIILVISCSEAVKEDSLENSTVQKPSREITFKTKVFEINNDTLNIVPAKITKVKAGIPKMIPYTGIKTIKAGIPRVVKIDKSKLRILTPGQDTIPNPKVYTLPEPTIKTIWQQLASGEYTIQHGNKITAPVIIRFNQPEPTLALPMRMKNTAGCNIQYLDMEQGLKDPMVQVIFEDSKGNMWFGLLAKGLCRYDGKSFYTYKEDFNNVWTIIEDRESNIWVATSYGVYKYDGKHFTHYCIPDLSACSFFSIFEVKNGTIWFGTSNGVFEKKGNIWTHYTENEGLISNKVSSIIEDKYGNIWFGTDRGMCKYDGKSFTQFTQKEGLKNSTVRSIIEDKKGNIWFGTEKGVCKYDIKTFTYYTVKEGLSNNSVISIVEDNSGNLWFGTEGGGVNMYDGNFFTHYTNKEGLSNDIITSIIEDKSKSIWLSTSGSGVMKLQKKSFTYFTQLDDIGRGAITSIIEDNGDNIWFTICDVGLVKFNGNSFSVITENEGLYHNINTGLLEDINGNIWISNNFEGLQKYNGKSFTLYREKNDEKGNYSRGQAHYIYEDKKGNIWLGTSGEGIKKFNGESFSDFNRSLEPSIVGYVINSIIQDNSENIWYGTIGSGIFKYDGESITQYTESFHLRISSIIEDKNRSIWIGIFSEGIIKYDGQSFTSFTEEEGLSDNYVSSIIEDKKGNIWVGTERGLSLLSPRGNGNYSITSFGTEDGLKDLFFNENSVCLDSRNRLWWGTNDEVTMLDLNMFEIITVIPTIQLNNIHINQEYIDFGALSSGIKELEQSPSDTSTRKNMRGLKFSDVAPFYNYPLYLELPHYLNHLTFNFSAIDWTAPQSIRYQYMLEGMDEKWSPPSKENKADYRNIPSGKYIFKVKAVNKNNIWSETFEYPFTVHPPWWLRWWAYTFYAMILILLIRYYIRYRIGRERIKAEIQIKQVQVDKMQELYQMKSRFFANISHEFRTPLTLLLGPINDLLKNQDNLKEGEGKLLVFMKRNAGRLQQLINQLLDLSKLETGKLKLEVSEGDLTGFIRTIVLSFLSLAESKRINYEYDLQDMSAPCFYDEDKIEKIMMNLISNALKFTPEGGSVIVTLYSREKDDASGLHAEIRVTDTGPGIPDDEKEKIFDRFYQVSSSDSRDYESSGIGLALTWELVQLYRGEIYVESEAGKGSTFTVMVPVSREHFKEGEIVAVSEKPSETKFFDDHKILENEAAESDLHKDNVILIVEDNTDLRKYISGILFRYFQILEAENGSEGLKKAIESIPDLVISDLMMPEMDGVEMCNRLKSDTRTNHIPLIMLTARADRESKLESLETGADDYIIKPFDAEELQVRVKNLIEQRKKLRERYRKEFLTDPADYEIPPPEDEFLVRVLDCTKKHMKDPEFNVEQLGKELHLSRIQLYRKVISLTDYTPSEFIRNIRLKMAARMFLEGYRNIKSVLYTVGYKRPSHFTQSFRELFGMNPSEYIKQKGKSKN